MVQQSVVSAALSRSGVTPISPALRPSPKLPSRRRPLSCPPTPTLSHSIHVPVAFDNYTVFNLSEGHLDPNSGGSLSQVPRNLPGPTAWSCRAPISSVETDAHPARLCLDGSLDKSQDPPPLGDWQPFTTVAGDNAPYRTHGYYATPRSGRSGYQGHSEHQQPQANDNHPASNNGNAGSGQQDDNGDEDEDDDEAYNNVQPGAGPPQQNGTGSFSCPFRKRNKKRFNVRDHRKCYDEFHNYGDLKFVHP